LKSSLDQRRVELDNYVKEYDGLRKGFLSMHGVLRPQNVAFVLESCRGHHDLPACNVFCKERHDAISERIESQTFIDSDVVASFTERLSALLEHIGHVFLDYERHESARKVRRSEYDLSCMNFFYMFILCPSGRA